jgi:hypothetical protein
MRRKKPRLNPNREDRDNPKPKYIRRRESPPESEAVAMFLAFPRRSRTGWIADGTRYILECGHTVSSDMPLDDDGKVRCRECYKDQMLTAKKMLER